ncbi:hypothetical protein GE107_16380 [Cohnella sp. CFH 77786]|nr:hypothetical protein [Cohnella sp. CFH 77786]
MDQIASTPPGRAGRAIVIGGSIAGLLAARVLADFFEEIVIVEADEPPEGAQPRNKVPQGHHSHVLLERGQNILESMFPGMIQELIRNGSIVTDFTRDLEWFHFGEWKQRFPSGIQGVQQTRPFLEQHIRGRVALIPQVSVQYRSRVTGMILSDDRSRVQGVKVRSESSQHEEEILADLVVDAGGAGSHTLKWLGAEQDTSEVVPIELFYATRYYTTDWVDRGWTNLMISARLPESPYAGVVLPFENQIIGVTLGGYLREPPRTEADFEQIARMLPQPHIYDFIQRATPVSEMKIYRIPSQSRKRKNVLSKIPARFIMIGDSYCRFDPLYGQGMSVAAMEAELLGAELGRLSIGDSIDAAIRSYWAQLPKLTQDPWDMALIEAYRHPGIKGTRPIGTGVKQWFTRRIYKASAHDPSVYLRLVQVMNLKRPSSSFFQPSLLWKLFR